jgi:hypothetical protein
VRLFLTYVSLWCGVCLIYDCIGYWWFGGVKERGRGGAPFDPDGLWVYWWLSCVFLILVSCFFYTIFKLAFSTSLFVSSLVSFFSSSCCMSKPCKSVWGRCL